MLTLSIICALAGCVDTKQSANTENTSSFDETSSEVEQTQEPSSEATPSEIIFKEDSSYMYVGEYNAGKGDESVVGPRCYELTNVTNQAKLLNIISILNDLSRLYSIGIYGFSAGKEVDFGMNVLHIASGKLQENIISDDPRIEIWDKKYPKTDTHYGPSPYYLEKKYVNVAIDKYFCADRENIVFDRLDYFYCEGDSVYSIMATGRDFSTIPILFSYEEKDNMIECIFSFAEFALIKDGPDFRLPDSTVSGGVRFFGDFQLDKKNIPEFGEVNYAQPYISPQDQQKLNKVKFTFCKDGDSLKIHSVEYL